MPRTYEPISTQTLAGTAASVTFSSIPQTYTDIILIANGTNATGDDSYALQFNGDTSTNYSITSMYGNAVSVISGRAANLVKTDSGRSGLTNSTSVIQLLNYSNATTYKSVLARGDNPGGFINLNVSLWRSTSAITSINISIYSGYTINAGSTFTLYGIKAA
jgi:hypothetical protein